MSETVTVSDGETTEEAEVIETYEHRGKKVLQVEGETLDGFVFA